MKRLISTFLILIFFMALLPARSQWIPCQGIEGASCRSIIQQDSFLFIDAGNGIFRRNINNSKWDSACLVGGFIKIRSTGDALFVIGGPLMGQFNRSLDNGLSWEELDLNYEYITFETLDSIIFIDTYSDGLLSSDNNGETWTNLYPSSESSEVSWIFAQDGIIFSLVDGIDSLYRSEDYGYNWISYPLPGVVEGDGYPYFYNEKLWLSHSNRFYLYNDLLSAWNLLKDSIPVNTGVSGFIEDSGDLCCYTLDGFFRFDAGDSAWIDCSQGLENRVCWDACKVGNSTYLATGYGPYSKQEGSEWVSEYDDLFGIQVSQVFVIEPRLYALAKGNIYYSDDLENGFEKLQTQGYCSANRMIITDTAWFSGSNCGFNISVDSGLSWTALNDGIEGKMIWDIAITDNHYFADVHGSGYGLFRSNTDSIAWERVPNEFGTSYGIDDIDAIDNILFVTADYYLYMSEDFGTTFETVPDVNFTEASLFVRNNKIFILRDYYDVIYSADAGNTWLPWISGLDNIILECMDITSNSVITILGGTLNPFYGSYFLKLFTPENPLGLDISANLPNGVFNYPINVLLRNGSIFASPASGGLWYRDDLMVGIKEDDLSKNNPSGSLHIFPNPVTDFLTINLQQNGDQSEYLIFDQLCRMMKMDLCESDNSQTTIEVSGFPQGVYFVVIRDSQGVSRAGKFVKID